MSSSLSAPTYAWAPTRLVPCVFGISPFGNLYEQETSTLVGRRHLGLRWPGFRRTGGCRGARLDGNHRGWPHCFPQICRWHRRARVLPVPLLSISYNDTFYVELLRAGVYLHSSEDKKKGLGLAIEPRFGFSSKDGARLAGMSTRRTRLERGPSFDRDLDGLPSIWPGLPISVAPATAVRYALRCTNKC